ncbi:cytochrome P450 [Coniophora puteana RWD-64-598 SS2]|uniref:Cytochrome P450 n=1 Tax=Coniophora puteana (strain RWD-64-598) TaxID=741705 RepID=A0A5M3MZN8_CONPW|nr:cytochrome P450 [Coniophora puteana RWD-64-598 SS2]EIW84496.1 cytochrome P450 [Coniophora puteana RWD-64-598 SS2]
MPASSALVYPAAAASLLLAIWTVNSRRKIAQKPFPPGPTPLPLLGNVHQLNLNGTWLTFTEWKEVYGDIVHFRMFGEDIIVLNTEEVAQDLLDRRSRNYSDRMNMPVIQPYDLLWDSVFLGHNDQWRAHRRLVHQGLRPDAVVAFRPMQLQRTLELLHNLATSPEDYCEHFQRFSAAVILGAVYDHQLALKDDPIMHSVIEAMEHIIAITAPENSLLVGIFPFLKWLPSWMPGGWTFNAARVKILNREMIDMPFEALEKNIASGTANHSLAFDALTRFRGTNKIADFEEVVKGACGTAYGAGAETTSSVLMVFLLAMVLNPDIQKRAQEEIDQVVGDDRLPDYSDRPSLPYFEAVFRETLRWRPVVPLSIPHATSNDDIYRGYFIPKGAAIFPNVWAMSQNPAKYPFSSHFMPERFFDADGKLTNDTVDFVFGFGRRVCVGRHLATGSLWPAMARILSMFNLERAKDAQGREIEPNPEWTTGITSIPKPFPCKIVLRRAYAGEYSAPR